MLKSLFIQLWWIFPLLIAGVVIKTPWFKGLFGEWLIRLSAKLLLDTKEYRPIHNVTLKTPYGTTQIDHIFVSRFGVFVIETKNYSGWIFGDEHQPMWTQRIFRKTSQFQNPLRQNHKHVKALEALLHLPTEQIHSIVVFVGGSEFKTKMPSNVTYAGGYISYIKSKTEIFLSLSEVDSVTTAISTGKMPQSHATNREHVQNIQRRLDLGTPRSCPKCGAQMVLRTANRGDSAGSKFWGCSAFPKCRNIQKVT
ncbi:MAG: NERD domain-containing protein [Sulfuriferula sp.]|nr:NERD domain-containing protein [Sulfuriferula sp.]